MLHSCSLQSVLLGPQLSLELVQALPYFLKRVVQEAQTDEHTREAYLAVAVARKEYFEKLSQLWQGGDNN